MFAIQDWERLHAAFWDLQTYWAMLEWKRKQLETEEKQRGAGQVVRDSLARSFKYIQLDLRDLMNQLKSQVNSRGMIHPSFVPFFALKDV